MKVNSVWHLPVFSQISLGKAAWTIARILQGGYSLSWGLRVAPPWEADDTHTDALNKLPPFRTLP